VASAFATDEKSSGLPSTVPFARNARMMPGKSDIASHSVKREGVLRSTPLVLDAHFQGRLGAQTISVSRLFIEHLGESQREVEAQRTALCTNEITRTANNPSTQFRSPRRLRIETLSM